MTVDIEKFTKELDVLGENKVRINLETKVWREEKLAVAKAWLASVRIQASSDEAREIISIMRLQSRTAIFAMRAAYIAAIAAIAAAVVSIMTYIKVFHPFA